MIDANFIDHARQRCRSFAERTYFDSADVHLLIEWQCELLDKLEPLLAIAADLQQTLETSIAAVQQAEAAAEAVRASINRISVN